MRFETLALAFGAELPAVEIEDVDGCIALKHRRLVDHPVRRVGVLLELQGRDFRKAGVNGVAQCVEHELIVAVVGIRQRLWTTGDDTIFVPGHGPESGIGRERLSNPYVGGGT